jgi:phosphatidylinositol glycan class W
VLAPSNLDLEAFADMSNSTDYKKLKEDFVSGLSGGSIGEINYVTAVAPVSIWP